MDKKVGILTFHYAINYGAVLQAYALSKACEKFGCDVEVINYYTRSHERANNIIIDKKRGVIRSIVYFLVVAPHYLQLKRKGAKFCDFQNSMLKLSRRYNDSSDLINNIPSKDVYITGSDQVFNPVSTDNVKVYYLDFKKKTGTRKTAYAPSFGISVFDEALEQKVGALLYDFDSLSCRENDGAAFLSSVTGKEVKTVLDPVFLLNSTEWSSIEKPYKNLSKKGGYIFVYDLNGRDNLILLAKKIQQKVNLPIVCLTTKKYFVSKYHVEKTIIDAGPREFLSLIHNAAYVMTDSFHGVSFSIIFKRPFIAYNALPKASQRIKSLLGNLNLGDYLIESAQTNAETILENISRNLDYESELNKLISTSETYLEESLK